MSQTTENSELQETANQSDASIGSPIETDNISAPDNPSEQDAAVETKEGNNFFDDDYLSNLGKTDENPADDKSDLSDLPGFGNDEPNKDDPSEEKTENADEAQAKSDAEKADAANPAEADNAEEKSKAEKAIDDDPNLTDEDKAAIKELPKSRWNDYRRAKTFAVTEAKFLDPNEKMSDFVGHLEQKSPARLKELQSEVLLSAVSTTDEQGNRKVDGTKLLSNLYESAGAETYTEVVATIVENYADQAVEMLKSKGFNLVKTGDETQINTDALKIDNEKLESVLGKAELFLEDDDVEVLRNAFSNRTAPTKEDTSEKIVDDTDKAAIPAEAGAETTEESEGSIEDKSEKSEQSTENKDNVRTLTPEEETNWNNTVNSSMEIVDDHLQNLMSKTFGMEVSEVERANIPELAAIKDEKREILLYGTRDGSLKPFDVALIERFREDESFKKTFDAFSYFALKGEKSNATTEIRKLIPFAEKLLEERLEHPTVKTRDAIIDQFSKSFSHKKTPENNIFIEGGFGGGGNNSGKSETNSFLDPSTL